MERSEKYTGFGMPSLRFEIDKKIEISVNFHQQKKYRF